MARALQRTSSAAPTVARGYSCPGRQWSPARLPSALGASLDRPPTRNGRSIPAFEDGIATCVLQSGDLSLQFWLTWQDCKRRTPEPDCSTRQRHLEPTVQYAPDENGSRKRVAAHGNTRIALPPTPLCEHADS